MKGLIIVACLILGTNALKCKVSSSKVANEPDVGQKVSDCNDNSTYCIKMTGNDHDGSNSYAFAYRGCSSELLKLKPYYHVGSCPDGGHFSNGEKVAGNLYCCEKDECNPASALSSPSYALIFLLVSALLYCLAF